MEALVGSRQTLTMTLAEYPAETSFGTKVTVQAEGLPGKLTYYGDSTLLQLTPGQRITDDVYLQSASRIRDDDVAVFNSKGVFLLALQPGERLLSAGETRRQFAGGLSGWAIGCRRRSARCFRG